MGHAALKDLIPWELKGLSHLCHCQVLLGPCQGAIWGDSPRGAVGAEPGQQQEPQVAQQPEEQQTAEGDDERHVPRRARVQVLLSRHNSETRLLKQGNRSSSKLHSDTNITFHLAELLHPGPRAMQRTGTGGREMLIHPKAAQVAGMDHWAPGPTKGRWNGAHPQGKGEVPDHGSISYIKTSRSW